LRYLVPGELTSPITTLAAPKASIVYIQSSMSKEDSSDTGSLDEIHSQAPDEVSQTGEFRCEPVLQHPPISCSYGTSLDSL
jgi:hypothetical protein